MPFVNNDHTSSLTYQPCCKLLNRDKKTFNCRFSILGDENTFPPCGNASSSRLHVAIWTRPHPEKHCIISWWLMLSPPCGPSATNHMNCWLIALGRCHRNCYRVVPNVFCIVEMTEKLVAINVDCEVGKSLETPSNVILYLPFWHCTPLGQVIKGLDFWSRVFHHSVDRHIGHRQIIVAPLFCSVSIQLSILKHLLPGFYSQNLETGLLTIPLCVRLFKILHHFFWVFRAYI